MCYDNDARPPLPPEEGGKAHGEDICHLSRRSTQFL